MHRRRGSFRPPFCPHRRCDSHATPGPWRFKKKGFYRRAALPRTIQRYWCHHCRRSFSAQTFSPTYWLRRPELLQPLFFRVLACSGYRQIAQELGVAHTTVLRQVERLGRHCLLFHEQIRPQTAPREPLVLDGFRSFEFGQYWPFDLNLLIGASHYVYGFNEAELRRSGTHRPSQRRKRERLEHLYGRPDPRATSKAIEELVGRIVPEGSAVELHSDEHRAYPRALRRLANRRIRHVTTPSRRARTAHNPLFPVNLADLLLRHTGANHKRETIAFSKRRQGALYRVAIWTVWRNYVKWSSERRRTPPPGVQLGLIPHRLGVAQVLTERIVPWRVSLGPWLERCYSRRIPTRRIPRWGEHRRRLAF